MAKKAELLAEAKKLKLEVNEKNTIAEIEAAIKKADKKVAEEPKEETKANKPTAKAGKRSEKAQRETEEKIAKETRKAEGDTTPQSEEAEAVTKKGPRPVTRPHSERRGKNYKAIAGKVEANKAYSLSEAMKIATETSPVKFDASVELHINLGVDPRQADQNIRATVTLPHGTGKTTRVAAFVTAEDEKAAKAAGADIVGEEALQALLDKEQLDFDVLVATPKLMPKLGKYARVLGPRGLMPNPKSGTVSTNPGDAVKAAKGGRVEYRVDKQAIIHLAIGKVSFGTDKLTDNAKAFFESLNSQKPNGLKNTFVKSAAASTTMGPGIKLDTTSL